MDKKIDFHDPDNRPFKNGQKIQRANRQNAKVHVVEGMQFVTGLGWLVKIPDWDCFIQANRFELVA